MPSDMVTTIGLLVVTLLAAALSVRAIWRVVKHIPRRGVDRWLATATAMLTVGLMVYCEASGSDGWQPMQSNLDGVLLMAVLLSVTIMYLVWVGRLRGIELFAAPVLAFISAWAVCASWWSFRPFDVTGVWERLHITVAYLAIVAAALCGVSGAAYLLVQRLLRRKPSGKSAGSLHQMASLESIEHWLIVSATVAFVLITIVLVLGVIDASTHTTSLGEHWWTTPKVIGSLVAWGLLAVVCHVPLNPRFRGAKAAALAVASFLVALAVLAMAVALGGCAHVDGQVRIGSDESAVEIQHTVPGERDR